MVEEAKPVEDLEPTDRDLEETEVIGGTEVYLYQVTRGRFAFGAVKIRLFTKQGMPIASGVRRVLASYFEVEAPGVNKLFVKRLDIPAAGIVFNYLDTHEFDLPDCLEVGLDGVLQKTVPGHFVVQIVSREVKVQETPESELPTRQTGDGPPCAHRGGMP